MIYQNLVFLIGIAIILTIIGAASVCAIEKAGKHMEHLYEKKEEERLHR